MALPVRSQPGPSPQKRVGLHYSLINRTVGVRLEAGFHYQEATLPPAVTRQCSYLKAGRRRYLLSRGLQSRDRRSRLREQYELRWFDGSPGAFLTWRYGYERLSANSLATATYWAGRVAEGIPGQSVTAYLTHDFEPEQVLEAVRAGQPVRGTFYYVTGNQPAEALDTLACYQVQPTENKGCLLTLLGRYDPGRRRWAGNHVTRQAWRLYTVGKGRWQLDSQRDGQYWTRYYQNPHAFTEILSTQPGPAWDAPLTPWFDYRRWCRQHRHRTIDTYEVLPRSVSAGVPVQRIRFTIITETR